MTLLQSSSRSPFGSLPYWRLSSFYFFYFCVVGSLMPYWALYLESLSFTAQEISWLLAIMGASRVGAPLLWGWLADKGKRRGQSPIFLVRMGALLTLMLFIGIFLRHDFWWLAVVMCGFAFFWSAILPLYEAVTLDYLSLYLAEYGKIRLWGSVGFIVAVTGLGVCFETYGIVWLPVIVFIFYACIWGCARSTPPLPIDEHQDELASTEGKKSSFLEIIFTRKVIVFLIVSFLLQLAFGTYYTYYSLYLTRFDYKTGTIGYLWSIGVIAEILLFLVMHRLVNRFGFYFLMMFSLLSTALRWMLVAVFPEFLWLQVVIQLIHAFSFGATHALAMRFIQNVFSKGFEAQGQSLYVSLCYGVGGVLGTLMSGYLWKNWGPSYSFLSSSGACVLACVIFGIAFYSDRREIVG